MISQTQNERSAWALPDLSRARFARLPTPLERGPIPPGSARLWIKRDNLTGLGLGGNKVRKLEFLCAAARQQRADMLVTVGAAQSNHCRLTAAAASALGLECHLFLGGQQASCSAGNQLLMDLFGAELHFPGTDNWDELEAAMEEQVAVWQREGRRPYMMPIGGSTAVGACGYAAAWIELCEQCQTKGVVPMAIVHASPSGGTHAGLLAGRHATGSGPSILAAAVAKMAGSLREETLAIARGCLDLLAARSDIRYRSERDRGRR